MDAFEVMDRRFATYIMANAPVEELATGFRWLEGPVWFGDANCLLFQDLPRNRTMRWSEETGVSVYRYPSDYANGQTRVSSPAPLARGVCTARSWTERSRRLCHTTTASGSIPPTTWS